MTDQDRAAATANPTAGRMPAAALVGRLILLGLAAGGLIAAVRAGRVASGEGVSAGAIYACPMHPRVTASARGECPICGMALRQRRGALATGPSELGGPMGPGGTIEAATLRLPSDLRSLPPSDLRPATRLLIANPILAPAAMETDAAGTAFVHRDQLALLRDQPGATFVAAIPAPGGRADADADAAAEAGGGRPVELDAAGAPSPAADRALRSIGFRLRRPGGLRAGQVGWLAFDPGAHPALVVPYAAVLQSPAGPYVLVVSDDRRAFTKRPIELGPVVSGFAVVLSGVREGERVVAANASFLDAERRLGGRPETAAP
jgi:multidrug efflux pump subunit AcrA (membrane-fusion protein)